MIWDFFERRVCLTTHDDEWQKAVVEFDRAGLTVEKFQSLPLCPGPHESFNASTKQILQEFYWSKAQTLLFVEDDCEFKDLTYLEQSLKDLPSDWDIVYLGANIREERPDRITENLYRIRGAWTTHCIGYRRKVIPFLLQNQPPFSETMFDTWLSNELHKLNAYIVAPMVAYQRFHASSIWGTTEDYTPIFEASQERLR